jgi:hypothetical protein
MSELRIITNNVPRDIIHGFELSDKERAEFDYYDAEELDGNGFFRYKGEVYDLGEFMPWDNPASPTCRPTWDGARGDSFFSAVVVRYVNDFEQVVVGLALS